jgi:hypothetical protein
MSKETKVNEGLTRLQIVIAFFMDVVSGWEQCGNHPDLMEYLGVDECDLEKNIFQPILEFVDREKMDYSHTLTDGTWNGTCELFGVKPVYEGDEDFEDED